MTPESRSNPIRPVRIIQPTGCPTRRTRPTRPFVVRPLAGVLLALAALVPVA